jgi:hypothetical protein
VALSGPSGYAELVQAVESVVNEAVFLAIAVYFLVTLETRVKRRAALRALHRLRSIVHIVDMHQLTKDPEYLMSPTRETASSPQRVLTRFHLARYLDYCSELLSLTSKLAALHAQYLVDPVVMGAVNDIETLAAGLSGKIWQKIMILDTAVIASELASPDASPDALPDALPDASPDVLPDAPLDASPDAPPGAGR